MRALSQQNIAQACGVSQAVVSLVLNGRRDKVSHDTYEKIWAYALEHGYQPKGIHIGSSTMTGRPTKYVGYILRAPLKLATNSNFFSHVMEGMDGFLRPLQIHTLFYGSEHDVDIGTIKSILNYDPNLAGLVIMGEVQRPFLLELAKQNKTVVCIGAREPGVCHSVNSSEKQAGYQLVQHLVELGHTHFAYIGSEYPVSRNRERQRSVVDALKSYSIDLDPADCYLEKEGYRNEGMQAAEAVFKSGRPIPTAWVVVGGVMARGVIDYLKNINITPGKEISVVAFDMTHASTDEHPQITGASAIPEKLGEEAARLIVNISKMSSDVIHDLHIPSLFVARDTSGRCEQSIK
jgi:LacI family transcriptional regulator